MKKVLLMALALLVTMTVCSFAQEAAPQAAPEAKTLIGKVVSVVIPDLAKGIKTGVVTVADEAGKPVDFVVNTGVKVVDGTMKAIGLEGIKKDEKVEVKYNTTPEGSKEATSINVVK